jgi:hypothetical protein
MFLLTTDWHLTDNPDNEYRWQVFGAVRQAKTRYPISHVFGLGDMIDRKDRFPSSFINRLVEESSTIAPFSWMRGNHDTTLHPPSFFSFMSDPFFRADVRYINEPTIWNPDLLLLPFSAKPKEDWRQFDLRSFKSVFMHATVKGAVTENGQVMEGTGFPMLPGSVKFYSGDVHVPQKVRNVEYVGCPHPIKFGDRFPCRMLLLDEQTFHVVDEIKLSPPRKLMLEIKSIDDLAKVRIRQGDQVKIRFTCDPSAIGEFGSTEAALNSWARESGASIAGTEVIVQSTRSENVDTNQTPETILTQFAEKEEIADDLLGIGLSLLREVA